MIKVAIKTLSEGAKIPTKGTPGAIAYDVFTPRNYTVKPGRQKMELDLALELPYGYEAKIEPRSGHASKGMQGVAMGYDIRADCDVIPGKVDSDYRGNIAVILHSHEAQDFDIKAGTAIAQLTIYRGEDADFIPTETLTPTERGTGGFGHTSDTK
ncbi:MAG: dUTP diphosphatase [Prevotella sp.]|nr:hypothetical protein [Lachnospiraceae bacterium]MCM1379541.1 dUTP diphosphatase [Bacteroides sp.]MCM1445856.1 dUTP diphosphatase [Prevotella sp.]